MKGKMLISACVIGWLAASLSYADPSADSVDSGTNGGIATMNGDNNDAGSGTMNGSSDMNSNNDSSADTATGDEDY